MVLTSAPNFCSAVKYAFQVGMDGESSDLDPFDYEGKAIKVSALDFLKMLI